MLVSYELLGVLAGVTKQAAHKSVQKTGGSGKRFLAAAVERALLSTSKEEVIAGVRARLLQLSPQKPTGRRVRRDPEGLAFLVGVPYLGEDLAGVFERFVDQIDKNIPQPLRRVDETKVQEDTSYPSGDGTI